MFLVHNEVQTKTSPVNSEMFYFRKVYFLTVYLLPIFGPILSATKAENENFVLLEAGYVQFRITALLLG